jgi:hypothetical protein
LIGLRTRQCSHDEVEIGCGKPRSTIRSNHRGFIVSKSLGDGKQNHQRYNLRSME